ncbi:thioredoxin [Candidatus Thorarchaeota archaeon]|nr:MAG: thioredoxin [Candidatus Thorarchaeota archaeon]
MVEDEESEEAVEDDPESSRIEIIFFKSDTCAFCPRAEEVLMETIGDFDSGMFKVNKINVSKNPEAAEEYGVFALPTIMIGGVAVTGIPEPEALLKMILGSRMSQSRGAE